MSYIGMSDMEIAQLENIQKFVDTVRLNPELSMETIKHLLNSRLNLPAETLLTFVPLVVAAKRTK